MALFSQAPLSENWKRISLDIWRHPSPPPEGNAPLPRVFSSGRLLLKICLFDCYSLRFSANPLRRSFDHIFLRFEFPRFVPLEEFLPFLRDCGISFFFLFPPFKCGRAFFLPPSWSCSFPPLRNQRSANFSLSTRFSRLPFFLLAIDFFLSTNLVMLVPLV